MNEQDVITPVKKWLEQLVIGLNLCPFAKQEFIKNRIHFYPSKATTIESLLVDLQQELERLNADNTIETTLLIHPNMLTDFYDYNDFLDIADGLLIDMELDGIYQIASFHPNYQFADTEPDDAENYTNRSPYPLLHLIRENSLEQAVSNYPNPELIPERNIKLMKKMGHTKLQSLFTSYFDNEDKR
ncbi:MAG: hypothetical protein COA83_00045 [Methylophaga sp.]|nr:MAG: hypothetical protein COA83_00045 [Methylophaga sp.]